MHHLNKQTSWEYVLSFLKSARVQKYGKQKFDGYRENTQIQPFK